jgi:CRP-like cAMP-binding protein
MDILDSIRRLTVLPADSAERLTELSTRKEFRSGDTIFRIGKTYRDVYLIAEGALRAYHPSDGEQRNFWFGFEGDSLFSEVGITLGEPSPETVETMEYSVLYHIDYDALRLLCQQDIAVSNWWNNVLATELARVAHRLITFTSMNASERYRQLLLESPHILQRVPLIHIASYLGVTPQSLSRIRAGLSR